MNQFLLKPKRFPRIRLQGKIRNLNRMVLFYCPMLVGFIIVIQFCHHVIGHGLIYPTHLEENPVARMDTSEMDIS